MNFVIENNKLTDRKWVVGIEEVIDFPVCETYSHIISSAQTYTEFSKYCNNTVSNNQIIKKHSQRRKPWKDTRRVPTTLRNVGMNGNYRSQTFTVTR